MTACALKNQCKTSLAKERAYTSTSLVRCDKVPVELLESVFGCKDLKKGSAKSPVCFNGCTIASNLSHTLARFGSTVKTRYRM